MTSQGVQDGQIPAARMSSNSNMLIASVAAMVAHNVALKFANDFKVAGVSIH